MALPVHGVACAVQAPVPQTGVVAAHMETRVSAHPLSLSLLRNERGGGSGVGFGNWFHSVDVSWAGVFVHVTAVSILLVLKLIVETPWLLHHSSL